MFSERLKLLRKNKNLSQKDLAKTLNISPSTIGMYEQGRRQPDTKTLQHIANYYGVSIDYLLGQTDNSIPYSIKRVPLKDRLKEIRITNKLNAKEFGGKFGIAESTISLYESGKRNPNKELLIKIADNFNISTDYLLGRTDNPTPYNKKVNSNDRHIDKRLNELIEEVEKTDNLIFDGSNIDEQTKRILLRMLKNTKEMIVEINLNAKK
ncbi:hypothetical protein AN1V17_33560 [Vallitalea sediminicola]